ncbi:MAG: hypothetical protein ABIQ39_01025 [Ilumatobacteraceae bacterium]
MKAKAAELSPGKLAKGAIHRVRESVTEGRRAMRAREAELWSRISGTHAGTLADDLDPNDVVIVDGELIEPGKVIVLRRPGESDRIRRRRS